MALMPCDGARAISTPAVVCRPSLDYLSLRHMYRAEMNGLGIPTGTPPCAPAKIDGQQRKDHGQGMKIEHELADMSSPPASEPIRITYWLIISRFHYSKALSPLRPVTHTYLNHHDNVG